jgi:dTDP-4-dehydrorhamnose 3,5-epimerase
MITNLKIKDSFLLDHTSFEDERGFFSEYLQDEFKDKYFKHFIQQNVSQSKKHVLRGLHFQEGNFGQAKLLTVMKGSIYDFFIDLRKGSPSYLETEVVFLTDSTLQSVYVPEGCTNGFFTLEKDNRVLYSVSSPRVPENERIINPIPLLQSEIFVKRIPPVNIREITISNKDRNAPSLQEYLNNH